MFNFSKPDGHARPRFFGGGGRRWVAVGSLVLVSLISACGGSSGGDGGTEPVVLKPTDAPVKQPASYVMFSLVDAQTGAPITQEATVTLSGSGASQAVNPLGEPVTQIKTTLGAGAFALKSTATPSASAPVVIQLGVVSRGYLSSGALLDITETGATERQIRLVRASFDASGVLTSAPVGVTGRQVTVASTGDGSLASNNPDGSFTLAIPSGTALVAVTNAAGAVENVAPPAASISIPAGVKAGRLVTSASGASTFVPAAAGPITAKVIAFSPQSADALRSFPGGFGVMPSAGGGITAPSAFQTAGFAAFEFTDAAGNPVDRFSGTVTLTTEAPAPTVAPGSSPLSVGAVIPVWSYSASTAEWKSEGSGTVTGKAANGNWVVSFLSTHLSYWNMDYFGKSCTVKWKVQGRNGDRRQLSYLLSGEGGNYWSHWTGGDSDDFISLSLAPADFPVSIIAYDISQGSLVEVGRLRNVSLCNSVPPKLTVTLLRLPPPRVINFQTVEACEDGSNVRPISTYLIVQQPNPPYAGGANWTSDEGRVTYEFYDTGTVNAYFYDVHSGLFRQAAVPDSALGTSQTVTVSSTMRCGVSPKPTGASGGSGSGG